ncbi:MAG: ATP-dependent helicase HrpB, partial [Acidobacteria bacterium]|nr:ATP-dependent helicase HrpB [Acidobacteriota bacterium]
ITIEGVRAVVESGLARVALDNRWSGLPRVEVRRISRASAAQRAGRAARTGPGRVIRLYTEEDLLRRPEHDTPEILRREMSQLCLDLHAAGLRDPHALSWLDAPPGEALEAAEELLHRLGALDQAGGITAFGRELAGLPLHPRLAALAVHGGHEGVAAAAKLAAGARGNAGQVEAQLRRMAPRRRSVMDLRKAYLLAFPDRVGRRVKGASTLLMSNGSSALLEAKGGSEFVVAQDIEERPEKGLPVVRQWSEIKADWLLELFPGRVEARETVEWNRQAERVEAVSGLVYDKLVLEESRGAMPDAVLAAKLLAEKALEAGLNRFGDPEVIQELQARAAVAGLKAFDVEAGLRGLCTGLRSLGELEQATRDGGLERALLAGLEPGERKRLETMAPERIELPSGRKAKIRYPAGGPPCVGSRLQDFFGMTETPRIGGGRVALVVQLLAPNHRPVQTTQDLAGFWERLYPQVRRELSRRYPRHAWPENPLKPG